jgi:hypothetical protein
MARLAPSEEDGCLAALTRLALQAAPAKSTAPRAVAMLWLLGRAAEALERCRGCRPCGDARRLRRAARAAVRGVQRAAVARGERAGRGAARPRRHAAPRHAPGGLHSAAWRRRGHPRARRSTHTRGGVYRGRRRGLGSCHISLRRHHRCRVSSGAAALPALPVPGGRGRRGERRALCAGRRPQRRSL